ncbi:MAG: helix-turn-helix domain-containing protein [Dichotomicrobium sp.]
MSFPTELRSLRDRLGISQAKVADILGVTRMTVYNWERGLSAPPDEPIRSKAQILAELEQAAESDVA